MAYAPIPAQLVSSYLYTIARSLRKICFNILIQLGASLGWFWLCDSLNRGATFSYTDS
jgi:hypothetical protein